MAGLTHRRRSREPKVDWAIILQGAGMLRVTTVEGLSAASPKIQRRRDGELTWASLIVGRRDFPGWQAEAVSLERCLSPAFRAFAALAGSAPRRHLRTFREACWDGLQRCERHGLAAH